MATFPTSPAPSYGANQRNTPKTRVASMGDGYEIRVNVGLNQNPKQWALRWQNISETDADTISNFLDARGGSESFDWTPPGEASSSKFICQSWNKTIPYKNRATIQATFNEVAEP